MIPETDVCLILEGTYPYVRGGVSSWVHSLLEGLPEISFSLLAVSPGRAAPAERKYALPRNVKVFTEVFVHELAAHAGRRRRRRVAEGWDAFRLFCRERGELRVGAARHLIRSSSERAGLTADDALFSRAGWDLIVERYQKEAPGTSFIDWFWTWRAIFAPLFQSLVSEIPPARLYHPLSTGYAGLLGAIAKLRTERPLLLTEHGIYVRERLIDIARADWIHEEPLRLKTVESAPNPLKALWTDFFVSLGQLTYAEADLIVALFPENQTLQHELGADPARTRVVPNGVRLEKFAPLAALRGDRRSPLRVGFVGRVVPIKDVKTLLRAFALVAEKLPEVEFWVVGPTDEDPEYFDECQELARSLRLEKLSFTGPKDVSRIYPEIDLMVLTSLSEGQPLTILEAACAGVPTVASDVGDCRSLIEGQPGTDRALGPSGIVTAIGDPEATARAILQLLSAPELRAAMSRAGATRATTHYGETLVLDRYREIYRALIAGQHPLDLQGALPRLRLVAPSQVA
jgi:glycosyltransferase involved in cell wall biosynthesis